VVPSLELFLDAVFYPIGAKKNETPLKIIYIVVIVCIFIATFFHLLVKVGRFSPSFSQFNTPVCSKK
jgi:hypothetical protein